MAPSLLGKRGGCPNECDRTDGGFLGRACPNLIQRMTLLFASRWICSRKGRSVVQPSPPQPPSPCCRRGEGGEKNGHFVKKMSFLFPLSAQLASSARGERGCPKDRGEVRNTPTVRHHRSAFRTAQSNTNIRSRSPADHKYAITTQAQTCDHDHAITIMRSRSCDHDHDHDHAMLFLFKRKTA